MGLSTHRRRLGFSAALVTAALLYAPSAHAQPAIPHAPTLPGPPPGPGTALLGPVPVPDPLTAPAPFSPAAPVVTPVPPGCPDVQVVFARGTTEAPGLGAVGQAFVENLQTRVGNMSVGVYPVEYPASPDFPTAVKGITDASTHVQQIATNCPATKIVLGGYSQGAAVMGFVTTELIPDGVSASDVPQPMMADVADHVAAIALLGTPSERFMNVIKQPPVKIGPLYQAKTIELCVPNDFVCSAGNDLGAHTQYISDGLVVQAADFAASRLAESPTLGFDRPRAAETASE